MRTPCHRLTFLLPPQLVLLVQPGRHQPCLHGCVLVIARAGLVTIEGPSRERVFEQASRFLRVHSKGRPAYAVSAILASPPFREGCRGGRDSWSIMVSTEVTFSPTSLPPAIMREQLEQVG